MDEFQRELERKKQKWEENIRKQNEEKKQKELELKKQLADQKKHKELQKLEELKRQTEAILEEERQRMEVLKKQKQIAAENPSVLSSINASNSKNKPQQNDISQEKNKNRWLDQSQDTMINDDGESQYNILESLIQQNDKDLDKFNSQDLIDQKNLNDYNKVDNQTVNQSQNINQNPTQIDIEQNEFVNRFDNNQDEEDDFNEETIPQKEFARVIQEQQQLYVNLDESVQINQSSQKTSIMQDSLMNSGDFKVKSQKYQQPFQVTKSSQKEDIEDVQNDIKFVNNSSQVFNYEPRQSQNQQSKQKNIQNISDNISQLQQEVNYSKKMVNSKNFDKKQDQQQKKLLGRKEEFLIKMQIEEQMKKMSKVQQEKKLKSEEEFMRKKQEVLAQVLGKKVQPPSLLQQQQPIQNQVIYEQQERVEQDNSQSISIQESLKQEQSSQHLNSARSSNQIEESSLNDRDSEYDEDQHVELHNPDKFGVTSHFGVGKPSYQQMNQQNFMQPIQQSKLLSNLDGSPLTNTVLDNDSELYKYSSEDTSSKNNNQDQRPSRIQSASSKNRQEYYNKYQMNMSVQSQDFDTLYQHGRTQDLQELNARLSQTQSQFRENTKPFAPQFDEISYGEDHLRKSSQNSFAQNNSTSIKEDSNLNKSKNSKILTFGKEKNQSKAPIDYSSSMVHIESSLGPENKQKSSDQDYLDELPEELKEYERQLLAQLDEQLDEEEYYLEDNQDEDQYSPEQDKLLQSKRQMDALDSKFKVSLGGPLPKQSVDMSQTSSSNDPTNDPLKEFYELQKKMDESKIQAQDDRDDFYDQFDQDQTNALNQEQDEDDEYKEDFYNQNQSSDEENQDNNNNSAQDITQPSPVLQKGIALDFGMDEGTIKERKLKKFEELKQRKLQEMEERKQQMRDKSGDRTASGMVGRRQNLQQKVDKSPIREKSPINTKKQSSPFGQKNNRDKSPVIQSKITPKSQAVQNPKMIRRPAVNNDCEEEKDLIQVSQSKLNHLQNNNQPLQANVPYHLLRKQQQRQDELQPTPKQTPTQNPASKKNFAKNSNKKIIKNSIQVILGGETNKQIREEVLKVIDETDHTYYVVMFRGNLGRQDYKALYSHDGSGQAEKIHGPSTVPEVLFDHMIEKFYRYDSGNKVFKELTGIKGFTLTTDAIALHKKYKQKVGSNILY
eukprot:403337017